MSEYSIKINNVILNIIGEIHGKNSNVPKIIMNSNNRWGKILLEVYPVKEQEKKDFINYLITTSDKRLVNIGKHIKKNNLYNSFEGIDIRRPLFDKYDKKLQFNVYNNFKSVNKIVLNKVLYEIINNLMSWKNNKYIVNNVINFNVTLPKIPEIVNNAIKVLIVLYNKNIISGDEDIFNIRYGIMIYNDFHLLIKIFSIIQTENITEINMLIGEAHAVFLKDILYYKFGVNEN